MKRSIVFLLAAGSFGLTAFGQPIITSADLFNKVGQYYRAYANRYEPHDVSGGTAYSVPSDLIGSPGPGQLWDFSKGPKDKVLRYDYISTNDLAQVRDFPDAKIAEQQTDETDSSQSWLFFEQVPNVGRRVYGFYAENGFFTPSNVFVPPIVDFPDRIAYGQEWSTSTTYENNLSINDPDPDEGGLFDMRQQITITSDFSVDAYGTIILPDEFGSFVEGIRISEEETIDFAIDFGDGTFDHIETDYVRNYYWAVPGYGIVAQLNSTQGSSPPPPNFPRATAFLRMFETNKKLSPGGGCTEPAAVTDLKIRVNPTGALLLTWGKAECATQYRVDYASSPAAAAAQWTSLGVPTTNSFWQGENAKLNPKRFYRVISLK